jgi:hypothetical protein
MTTGTTATVDWTRQLDEQLDWHWTQQLRPRLDGLTDDEYRWEPVPGCWNLRPRGEASTAMAAGGGDLVIDFELPEPVPAPVTTIAWRLGHVIVDVLGGRNASHFGGPPIDHQTYAHPVTAAGALAALDEVHDAWTAGVRSLDDAALAAPCGPAEGPYAELPMAALVLHINREVIHHGAEVALLRDLYTATGGARLAPTGASRDGEGS